MQVARGFKKQTKKKQQKPSLFQSISSSFTNFTYGFKKYVSEITHKDQDQYQKRYIFIQGKTFNNRYQAKKKIKQILWFSYRKGFNIKNQFTSDVGWGCLIRVGQMALASALNKFFLSQSHMNFVDVQDQFFSIIASFSDVQGRQQKYSLNKIIQIAEKQFGQKPGEWFDLSKISYCLRILQNKYPMKGSQNLEISFFDQSLNFPTIFKILGLKQCNCAKKKIVCQKCHSKQVIAKGSNSMIKLDNSTFKTFNADLQMNGSSMKKRKNSFQQLQSNPMKVHLSQQNQNLYIYRHKRFHRDILVILLTRTCNSPNTDKAIFTLLDLPICLGIMTGFPKKAIFVIGRQNGQLIYLDPHYVQQNIKFQATKKQSYFCQQYLLTQRSALDPSMAFCFYLQNLYELQMLTESIQKIHRYYKDSLSIAVDAYKTHFNFNDYQQQEDDMVSVMSFTL